MPELTDAQKIEMAKAAAKVAYNTLMAVPHEVQLEAALIIVKSLFMASVKPTHRISLFNSVMQKMRADLKEHLKTGVAK